MLNPHGPVARLVFIILLVAGAPFALLGLYEVWDTFGDINRGGQATGTVVDNTYSVTQDGTTESGAYYPVVEFTTAADETIHFTDGVGSLPPDYAQGDQVPVLYDPAGLEPPRLASWKRLWLVPTIFLIVGALPLTGFALWLAVTHLQARLRPPPEPAL